MAARQGQYAILRKLIKKSADVNVCTSDGGSVFKILASDDSLKARNILKLMLAHDADPTLSDAQGFSTIHNASSRDNLPLVKFLIETAKVPVNTPLSEFNEGYYQSKRSF